MSSKIAALVLAISFVVVSCDAFDSMTDGVGHSQAVSTKLEGSLGLKSHVGFNWNNGSLDSVTVTFEGVPKTPGLAEISSYVRQAVLAEFKQTPKTIVIAFSVAQ